MRIRFVLLGLFLVATVGVAQEIPTATGVYVQTAGGWTKLFMANVSGARADGAGKSMLTFGAASLKSVLVYRDREAPVRITAERPVICVVGPMTSAPRDIVIVKLAQKKDHRELAVGKSNAYTGMKMEYPAGTTTEVDVSQRDGATFIIPRASLAPGEYIAFVSNMTAFPAGYGGYDFSLPGSHR